jgi:hypothetical protein
MGDGGIERRNGSPRLLPQRYFGFRELHIRGEPGPD